MEIFPSSDEREYEFPVGVSYSGRSRSIAVNGLDNEAAKVAEVRPESERSRSGRTGVRLHPATARWQLGRLVRVSMEAACGFIRVPSGELIYFAMQDVIAGGGG